VFTRCGFLYVSLTLFPFSSRSKKGLYLVNFKDVEFQLSIGLVDNGIRSRELMGRRRLIDCGQGFNVVFDVTVGQNPTPNVTQNCTANATTDDDLLCSGDDDDMVIMKPNKTISFGGRGTDKNASDAYFVWAYICTPPFNDQSVSIVPMSQGDEIRVCVQPNQRALNEGLYMRRIDHFTFKKSENEDITQKAIVGGQADSYGLTTLVCTSGSTVCYFDTLLRSSFYYESGKVIGGGEATLQFGSAVQSSRRVQVVVVPHDRSLARDRNSGFDDVQFEVISLFDEIQKKQASMDWTEQNRYGLGSILMGLLLFVNLSALAWVQVRKCRRARAGGIFVVHAKLGAVEEHHTDASLDETSSFFADEPSNHTRTSTSSKKSTQHTRTSHDSENRTQHTHTSTSTRSKRSAKHHALNNV
jgi:hypothetical protein